MSIKERHIFEQCITCGGSGLIPLDATARRCLTSGLKAGTCGDWLECSDCKRGKIEMVERIMIPTAHSVVML